MAAADHKTIIEIGADFKIDLRVTTNGVNAYNLGPTESNDGIANGTGYTPLMYLMFDNVGTPNYIKSDGTTIVAKTAIHTGAALVDGLDGSFSIILDDATTSLLTTYKGTITETLANNPFATEYNYYYSIELTNATPAPLDLKVLRGRCSIRV